MIFELKFYKPNLNDVVDFGLDEVEQSGDASLGGLLHLDGAAADGANRLPHEVDVDLGGVPEVDLEHYMNTLKTDEPSR